MEITELKAGQLSLCKELRLRALQDAPAAFGDTFAEAAGKPIKHWQKVCEFLTISNKNKMFILEDSGNYYGSVYALTDMNEKNTGRIGGMWVDSTVRRKGLGTALFQEVQQWARGQEYSYIKLWVEDIDEGAKLFYARLGFKETGVKDVSRAKIDKDLCEMRYTLRA